MKVWRIGSNWGTKSILPIIKEYSIVFAGEEVGYRIEGVKPNDLIAITNGQPIVAVGRVQQLIELKSIKAEFADEFADVTALKIDPLFFVDDFDLETEYYGGQGKQFHEAHDPYKTTICNTFNQLTNIRMQKNIESLLEYKKQIILQGPPGTGKTKLAKEIAIEMTRPKHVGGFSNKINDFVKNFDSKKPEVAKKRSELKALLEEFHAKFPKEKIKDLTLEEYAFGRGDNDTFCYWLEYVLWEHGLYSGFAKKFLIFWKREIEDYSKSGFLKGFSNEEAMKKLAEILHNLVNNIDQKEAIKHLGNGLILKVLYSYYPDIYFPINNVNCINNGLRLLGYENNRLNLIEKNKKLQELFLEIKNKFKADITNLEFMRFLFDNFDMKGKISIQSNEIILEGDFKLIQFHPAYSYEDFVRGIKADTNEEGQIEYNVVNKLLAEFAEMALDNPSANYVLIIDEINRANLPAVLGELIYALEYRYDSDKPKETTVQSMYSLKENKDDEIGNSELKLPPNLYIIGTMNTADRSVGHIDYAIRRRFAFVDILSSESVIDEVVKDASLNQKAKELYGKVASLFNEISSETTPRYLASDFKAKDVQLGHSYFLAKTTEELKLKLEYEIKPLLNEYMKDGILNENAKVLIEAL